MSPRKSSSRERMILSAAALLREYGAGATGIDRVLMHSGAPRGSVYHHFPAGRAQLIDEAVALAGDFIAGLIDGAMQADDPLEAIGAFFALWRDRLAESGFRAGCPGLARRHSPAAPRRSGPLASPKARDFAVRDYRRWLLQLDPSSAASSMPTPRSLRSTTSTCGAACASKIDRDDLPKRAPRALEEKACIRWLRAVEQVTSPRDRCIALIPYYAGARISEIVRLDVGDVRRSARKGVLRIYGKGDKSWEQNLCPRHAKSCSYSPPADPAAPPRSWPTAANANKEEGAAVAALCAPPPHKPTPPVKRRGLCGISGRAGEAATTETAHTRHAITDNNGRKR